MTELHGGVHLQTSIPRKRGTKMKGKKKFVVFQLRDATSPRDSLRLVPVF